MRALHALALLSSIGVKSVLKRSFIRDLCKLCPVGIIVGRAASETVQETQRSSFLTPLAPLIRGELSGKSP